MVHRGVVEKNAAWFQNFGANVSTKFDLLAEHTMPTTSFGNACYMLESPYIGDCDYDGVGDAFKWIYGSSLRPKGQKNLNNLVKIDQSRYFPSGSSSVAGLGDVAYLYVPTACSSGIKCSVHVVFHGCNQDIESIGTVYVTNTGYLGWAESNNIIVLFPQSKKSFLDNPNACFNWFGYAHDPNYAFKTGLQMQTVYNMVQAIGSKQGPILASD